MVLSANLSESTDQQYQQYLEESMVVITESPKQGYYEYLKAIYAVKIHGIACGLMNHMISSKVKS